MKILFFGIYDPKYSRNRVLIKGLGENGAEIVEINVSARSKFKLIKLFWKYIRSSKDFDILFVGFPGQEVMFLAKLLTRKPIIFDVFTSHYGGYILDRAKFPKDSLRAKHYRFLDKYSCKIANLCLLDTQAHIDFFVEEFGLRREKFTKVYVGTDEDIFYPKKVEKGDGKFLVHFHGTYIPLQGVKYIIKAAKLLEKENIVFNLIGRGQTYAADKKLVDELKVTNINFMQTVEYGQLPNHISRADICLGIFGETLKADIVIPNKIYEAIACGKTVITADTTAIKELFIDNENILLCRKADANDLAEKIMALKNNPALREKIARNGWRLFVEKLNKKTITTDLFKILGVYVK